MAANGRTGRGIFSLAIAAALSIHCMVDEKFHLDPEYSEFLTTMASSYRALRHADVADTVDLLRVYSIRQKHFDMYSLRELARKEPIFDSEDKEVIRKLVASAEEMIVGVPECRRDSTQPILHVVAFDRSESRVGYFTVAECIAGDRVYGEIRNLRNSGMYYNQEFLANFRSLALANES